ncbi:MAG: prepilin-type N-terminal cleavage/methylation domain-containing protein [Kiritimatiellae bacterium]|nr:prepilin-type N-terminal cleavage/methylation domain-containing protein [Kiritimatiellia bacterium]
MTGLTGLTGWQRPSAAARAIRRCLAEPGNPVHPVNPVKTRRLNRAGFSLIEVVFAAAILGVSLGVLLTAASKCLLVLSIATHYQEAQLVRSQAEVEYPLIVTNELEELEVTLMTLDNGMTFERVVEEEDEDEDDLYVVTTRVGWSARGADRVDEVVQYVYHEDEDDE